MSSRSLALGAMLFTLSGCSASAQFHSKTGRAYRPVTAQAVQCDEPEARLVASAGADVIGTISAKGLHVRASDEDLVEKAAAVAAAKGGTHVVLTDKGVEQFTVHSPAQKTKQCVRDDNEVQCQTTYTPASERTYSKPTASFVVLRLRPEDWPRLPSALRPVATQ